MATVSRPRTEAQHEDDRLLRHGRLSAWLQSRSDEELLGLELAGEPGSVWGTTGVAHVDGEDVFVKRVPVTHRELTYPYSTRNHFALPAFYQYGVGSAGFGAFREAVALEAVTCRALRGGLRRFPLLYHQRLLPGSAGPWVDRMSLEDYVRYWANNPAVADMMGQRLTAAHELWLFTEHVPHTVSDWLMVNQGLVDVVIDQIAETAAELRAHGVVHFDAHLANVMTDGTSIYLADFGLASSPEFSLSPAERSFLLRHPHYDLGLAVAYLGIMLAVHVDQAAPDVNDEVRQACGLTPESDRHTTIMGLVDGAGRVADVIELAPEYLEALDRYRDVIAWMHDFLARLQAGSDKSASYDDAEVLARLRLAGTPHLD